MSYPVCMSDRKKVDFLLHGWLNMKRLLCFAVLVFFIPLMLFNNTWRVFSKSVPFFFLSSSKPSKMMWRISTFAGHVRYTWDIRKKRFPHRSAWNVLLQILSMTHCVFERRNVVKWSVYNAVRVGFVVGSNVWACWNILFCFVQRVLFTLWLYSELPKYGTLIENLSKWNLLSR